MTFFSILESIFIGPLKLIFEIIFGIANNFVGHPGIAIIFLSLVMNILVLPLYKRADIMQEQTRDKEASLEKGVTHIKKAFSGDERMMILQTYYRQNNYKPTDALNGSVSLLLEIPFFMAAYQFLSNLDILNGVSLGPIKDLGVPDGLISIGGITLNLLPILMTIINIISSYIYLKGFPLKTKIQLYGMAIFFLFFLYTSPACLVFYWTLNNLFSLIKTIFYKLKNPGKILNIITSIAGIGFIGLTFIYNTDSIKRKIFLLSIGLLLQLPLISSLLKNRLPVKILEIKTKPNKAVFVLGCLFISVLMGLLIPSNFIAASPQEYVDVTYFYNPLWYIVNTLCLSFGTFTVWCGVFYWISNQKGKVIFERIIWILAAIMLVNYLFFGTNLGIISASLQFEKGMVFALGEHLINAGIILILAALLYFVIKKWQKALPLVLVVAIIAVSGMSAINISTANKSVNQISVEQNDQSVPSIKLSKTNKNVVVIMLDRALGSYVPYIFNEKPELKEKFSGFTYYDNVISYGPFTNFGVPALYGGYEYTPKSMNERSEKSLSEKHNEALKLMPTLFSQNGYNVTFCDPTYAGYQWISDLTIFDDIPNTKAYKTNGKFGEIKHKKAVIDNNLRNFFCFSFMKTMPTSIQPLIYNSGKYHQLVTPESQSVYSTQSINSKTTASGISATFMNSYNVLTGLPNITSAEENEKGTFLLLTNDTTHEPMLLQTPDYVPSNNVDISDYYIKNADKFTINGKQLTLDDSYKIIQYQANVAAFIQVANWLDYLREIDVYDNTRIILVSDHGCAGTYFDNFIMDDGSNKLKNTEYYFPLLMVKDFDSSKEISTSNEFMTNADVPYLATKDIISNPKNPFTGNSITPDAKNGKQYIIVSNNWDINNNSGNTFTPSLWASVEKNIWNKSNWKFSEKEAVNPIDVLK